MTTTRQSRCPLPRRAIRALRRLNDELIASGEAMARSARAPRPQADQAMQQTMLTCTWVTADDGSLIMRWTGQEPGDTRVELMTQAAA